MGGRKRPISELRKENEDEGENLIVRKKQAGAELCQAQ